MTSAARRFSHDKLAVRNPNIKSELKKLSVWKVGCSGKEQYGEKDARDAVERMQRKMRVVVCSYRCGECGHFHIGRPASLQ